MQDSNNPWDLVKRVGEIQKEVQDALPKKKIKKEFDKSTNQVLLVDEYTGDKFDTSGNQVLSGVKDYRKSQLNAIDKKIIETQDQLSTSNANLDERKTDNVSLLEDRLEQLYNERDQFIDNHIPESNAVYRKMMNEKSEFYKNPIGSRPDGTPLFATDIFDDYEKKSMIYTENIRNIGRGLLNEHPILKGFIDENFQVNNEAIKSAIKSGKIDNSILKKINSLVPAYQENIDAYNSNKESAEQFKEQSPFINSNSQKEFEKLNYLPISRNTAIQVNRNELDLAVFDKYIKPNPAYLKEYLENGNLSSAENFLESKKEKPGALEQSVYQGYYPTQFQFTNPSDYEEYQKLKAINAIHRIIKDDRKLVADDFWSGLGNMGKETIKGAYNSTIDLFTGFANIFIDKQYRDAFHIDRALNPEYSAIANDNKIDPKIISQAYDLWEYNNTPLFGGYWSSLAHKTGKVTGDMFPFIWTLGTMGANAGMFKLMETTEGMTVGKILSSSSIWKEALPVYTKSALAGIWNTFPKYAVNAIDDLKRNPNATWLDYAIRLTLATLQSSMEGMSEATGAHFLSRGIGNVLNKFSKEAILFNGGLVRRARDYFLAENIGEVLEERVNDLLSDEFLNLMQGKPWMNEDGEMRRGLTQFVTDKIVQSGEEYLMFMFSSGAQTGATVKNLRDDIRFQTFADHLWNQIKTDPELSKYNLSDEQINNIEKLVKSVLPFLGSDKKLNNPEVEKRATELLKMAAIDEGLIDMHKDKGVDSGALLRAIDRSEQMNHLNNNWNSISNAIRETGRSETKEDLEKMIMTTNPMSVSDMTYDRYINDLNERYSRTTKQNELRVLAEDNKDIIINALFDNVYQKSEDKSQSSINQIKAGAEKEYADAMEKSQYSYLLQKIDDYGKDEFINNFQDFSWDNVVEELNLPKNSKVLKVLPALLAKYGYNNQPVNEFLSTLTDVQSWDLYNTLYNPAGIDYSNMLKLRTGRDKVLHGDPSKHISYSKENFDISRVVTVKGNEWSRIPKDYYVNPDGTITSLTGYTEGLQISNPDLIEEVNRIYNENNRIRQENKSSESKGYDLVDRKELDGKLSTIKDGKILIAKNITTEEFTDYIKESKIAKNIGADRIMNAVNQTSIENFLFFYNTAKLKNPDVTQESAINQAIVSIDKQVLGAMIIDYNKGDVANTDNLEYIPTHDIEKNIHAMFKSIVPKIPTTDINFIGNISNRTSQFQGYKGGFEDKGKGTSEGDGKDKAMRQVADGFIGEIVDENSSSYTSYLFFDTYANVIDGVTYSSGWDIRNPNQKPKGMKIVRGIKINNNIYIDTIGRGVHGALYSRLEKDNPNISNEKLEDVLVNIENNTFSNDLKNWNSIDNYTVYNVGGSMMLARNSQFKGKPLNNRTKELILDAHNIGLSFVVGDMPNVDSQFIDYLDEIGAKYTIYHTGNIPRISKSKSVEKVSMGHSLNNISRSTEDISSKIVYSDNNTLVINTDAIQLLNMLEDNSIDIVLTDPPFGINYKYNKFNDTKENVQRLVADFIPEAKRVGKLVVITPGFNKEVLSQYPNPDYKLDLYGDNKQSLYIYGKLSNEQIDNLKLVLGTPLEDVRLSNNLNIPSKPIRLWTNILHALGSEGDLVLDPFAGSGTTTLAARKLGMYNISNDIDADATNLIRGEIERTRPRGIEINYKELIDNASPEIKHILNISDKLGGMLLVGSTALAKDGTMYRPINNQIHDLDYRVDWSVFSNYNINNIDEFLKFLDDNYGLDKDSKGNIIENIFQGINEGDEERVTVAVKIKGIPVDFFITEHSGRTEPSSIFSAKFNLNKNVKKVDRFKDIVDFLNYRYYDNSKFRLYGREEFNMGYYDFSAKNIGIYIDNIKKSTNPNYMFIKTVTHETVHRALDHILNGRIASKFEKSGLDLFNDFKKFIESGKYSGIQDIYERIMNSSNNELMQMHEFFAEALSNYKFQSALITMSDNKYKTKLGHLLSEIANWIAKLFNSVLKTQIDGNLLFETINLVHTSLDETNITTARNLDAIQKLVTAVAIRNGEFVTDNIEGDELNTQDINNLIGNSDRALLNGETNNENEEELEESIISNVIIKQIVDSNNNPLFATVQAAADYVNTHTFEEFKEYIKNARFNEDEFNSEYPYESYASNVYRLFSSRKRYRMATISYGEGKTIINTTITNYKDVEGLDKSTMLRKQHFDNIIDALRAKGITLEILPIVRVDYNKESRSKVDRFKSGKEIAEIWNNGYFIIPTNNQQFLVPKDSIQGLELTGDMKTDNSIVFQALLDIATQEKDPYTDAPISNEKKVKRFGNMLGSASKFWISPEIADWISSRKDRIRVDNNSVFIYAVVLNLDNIALPEDIKKYFDSMKDGIFADGAVFSSADVHQLVHMANGVPVEKWGGAVKWKRSEPSLLIKAADFEVEPDSPLDRFMKNVKWIDDKGVQHIGVERIIVKSALKIGQKGMYKDNPQLTWNDIMNGQFGKEIDGRAVINYDMSKDSFINAKGKVKRTADGATPSWLSNSLAAYIPEISDIIVEEMNKQTDKFVELLKGISNKDKVDKMRAFLKSNANLETMVGYQALELLMNHDAINTLDPMFFEYYVKNIFAPAFIDIMKHTNKGNTPVIRPDMGPLGNLKNRAASALRKSLPANEVDKLINEAFNEYGYLKPGYVVIDESQNKIFNITTEKIVNNKSDIITTVNPPAFFTDARVVRVIAVIPNNYITINNVKIATDKNTIYVAYEDFIYRSGKDFDIDNVISFKNDRIAAVLRNINNELGDRALSKFDEYKVSHSEFNGGKEGFTRIYGENAPKFLYKLLEMFGERDGTIDINNIERLTKLLTNDEKELGLEIGRLFSIKVFHDAIVQTNNKSTINIYPNIYAPNGEVLKKVELEIKDVDVNLALMKHLTDLTIDWKSDQRILKLNITPAKLLFQVFNINLDDYLIKNPDEQGKIVNNEFIESVGNAVYKILSRQIGSFRALLRNPKDSLKDSNLKGLNKVRGIIKYMQKNSKYNNFKNTLVARVATHFVNKISEMPKFVLNQEEMDKLERLIWDKMGSNGRSFIELDFISLFSRIGNAPKLGKPTDVADKTIINGTFLGKAENGMAHIAYTLMKWRQLQFGDRSERMVIKNYNPFIDLLKEIFSNGKYRLESIDQVQFKNKIKNNSGEIINAPFNQCYHVLKNEGGLVKFSYQRWYTYEGRQNTQTLFETNDFNEYLKKLQEPGLFSMSMQQINTAFADSDMSNWFNMITMRSDENRRATFKVLSEFIPYFITYKTNNFGTQSTATHGMSNDKYEETVYKSLLGLYKGDGYVEYGLRFPERMTSTYANGEKGIINYPYSNFSPGIIMVSKMNNKIATDLLNKYFMNRSSIIDNMTNTHPHGRAMSLDSLTNAAGALLPGYKEIERISSRNIEVNNIDMLGSIPIKNRAIPFNGWAIDHSFNVSRPMGIKVKLSGSQITHYGLGRVTSYHLEVEKDLQNIIIRLRALAQKKVGDITLNNYFENVTSLYEDIYKIADGTDDMQLLSDYNPLSTKQTGLVYGKQIVTKKGLDMANLELLAEDIVKKSSTKGNMRLLLMNQIMSALYLRYVYDYSIPNTISEHLNLLNLYKLDYDKLNNPEALGVLMTEIDKFNSMLESTTQMATYLKQHVGRKDKNGHYVPSFYLPRVHANFEDMLLDLQKSGMTSNESIGEVNRVKEESMVVGETKPSGHHFYYRSDFGYTDLIVRDYTVHEDYLSELARILRYSQLSVQYLHDRMKWMVYDNPNARINMDRVYATITNQTNMSNYVKWDEVRVGDGVTFVEKVPLEDEMKKEIGKLRMEIYRKLAEQNKWDIDIEESEPSETSFTKSDIKFSKGRNTKGLQNLEYRRFFAYWFKKMHGIPITHFTENIKNSEFHNFIWNNKDFIDEEYVHFGTPMEPQLVEGQSLPESKVSPEDYKIFTEMQSVLYYFYTDTPLLYKNWSKELKAAFNDWLKSPIDKRLLREYLKIQALLKISNENYNHRYRKVFGEVTAINPSTITIKRNVKENGEWVTKTFAYNKMDVTALQKHNAYKLSQSLSKTLDGIGIKLSDIKIDAIASALLRIGSKAMLGLKLTYSMINYAGATAMQFIYFGRTPKNVIQKYAKSIKEIAEGTDGNIDTMTRKYIKYVVDNMQYFLGGVDKVLGLLADTISGAEETDLKMARIAKRMGGKTNLLKLISEGAGESRDLMNLIEEYGRKPTDAGYKEIILSADRMSLIWNKLRLSNPLMWVPKMKDHILANAFVTEFDRRQNSSLRGADFAMSIAKMNPDADVKVLDELMQMITFSIIDAGNKYTNFLYIPGLYLSRLGSTPLGRNLDQFAHYLMSACSVMYDVVMNMIRQHQDFANIPHIRVGNIIKYEVEYKGQKITMPSLSAYRQFWRAVGVLFSVSMIKKMVGMTSGIFANNLVTLTGRTIIDTMTRVGASSMQIPVFDALMTLAGLIIKSLVGGDDDEKNPVNSKEWNKNRSFWRRFLPESYDEKLMETYARINKEDVQQLVANINWKNSELARSVLIEYQQDLYRSLNPIPLGVGNKFIMDMTMYLFMTSATPMKSEDVGYVLLNQLETIVPGMYFGRQIMDWAFTSGKTNMYIPRNKKDKLLKEYEIAKRNINKLNKMYEEKEITATQKTKWEPILKNRKESVLNKMK